MSKFQEELQIASDKYRYAYRDLIAASNQYEMKPYIGIIKDAANKAYMAECAARHDLAYVISKHTEIDYIEAARMIDRGSHHLDKLMRGWGIK